MKDVDRPADIKMFPQPAWTRRPCVDAEALRDVSGTKHVHRIGGCCGRLRRFRQEAAIRSAESQRPVGPSIDLKALLVDRPVVVATEQREVRECRWATLSPVADVMPLAEAHATAGEAAAAVPMLERPA